MREPDEVGGPQGEGRIVLVGTPIGNLGDLTPRATDAIAGADVVLCEDTRRTRALLSAAGVAAPRLVAHHARNESAGVAGAVALAAGGATVAVVSDAGMPLVSDPGARLVAAAAAAGVVVTAVPGPTAVVTALVLSGLPSERWCMEGFLPRKGSERRARLEVIAGETRTSVVYEAPHRVERTLGDLAGACGPRRPVAVARELTKLHEEVWRGTLADAAETFRGERARGEMVLVVGGRPSAVVGDERIVERLVALADAGAGRRDAVAEVAAELGIGRSRVYDLELRHRSEAPGGAAEPDR